jgi:predicted phosphate transport protein (TIGR00153 family)
VAVRIFPREAEFFALLEKQAAIVLKGASVLARCLEAKPQFQQIVAMSEQIHAIENDGDDVVHQLMERLNKTFLTPLDREDIYQLCTRMDDILDYIDAVAKRLVTFKIDTLTPHAIEFVRIIEVSASEVEGGVRLLRDLRRHEEIIRQCTRINQLENEADQVMREALNRLFNGEAPDPLDIIKWMDLYEHLEIATDKCEDVANVIQTVLVKYS